MSNHDPLEAAKITGERRGPGRPPSNNKGYTVVSQPSRETQPPQSLTRETQAAEVEEIEPENEAQEVRLRSFRVLETRTLSWMGSVTTLAAGNVVTESGYSIAGIKRLQDQGVKLEEIL